MDVTAFYLGGRRDAIQEKYERTIKIGVKVDESSNITIERTSRRVVTKVREEIMRQVGYHKDESVVIANIMTVTRMNEPKERNVLLEAGGGEVEEFAKREGMEYEKILIGEIRSRPTIIYADSSSFRYVLSLLVSVIVNSSLGSPNPSLIWLMEENKLDTEEADEIYNLLGILDFLASEFYVFRPLSLSNDSGRLAVVAKNINPKKDPNLSSYRKGKILVDKDDDLYDYVERARMMKTDYRRLESKFWNVLMLWNIPGKREKTTLRLADTKEGLKRIEIAKRKPKTKPEELSVKSTSYASRLINSAVNIVGKFKLSSNVLIDMYMFYSRQTLRKRILEWFESLDTGTGVYDPTESTERFLLGGRLLDQSPSDDVIPKFTLFEEVLLPVAVKEIPNSVQEVVAIALNKQKGKKVAIIIEKGIELNSFIVKDLYTRTITDSDLKRLEERYIGPNEDFPLHVYSFLDRYHHIKSFFVLPAPFIDWLIKTNGSVTEILSSPSTAISKEYYSYYDTDKVFGSRGNPFSPNVELPTKGILLAVSPLSDLYLVSLMQLLKDSSSPYVVAFQGKDPTNTGGITFDAGTYTLPVGNNDTTLTLFFSYSLEENDIEDVKQSFGITDLPVGSATATNLTSLDIAIRQMYLDENPEGDKHLSTLSSVEASNFLREWLSNVEIKLEPENIDTNTKNYRTVVALFVYFLKVWVGGDSHVKQYWRRVLNYDPKDKEEDKIEAMYEKFVRHLASLNKPSLRELVSRLT